MTRPDCPICGEDHAEVDCPMEICASCCRLDIGGGCDCRDPEPVSVADWIAAGRPAARRLPEPVDPEEARRVEVLGAGVDVVVDLVELEALVVLCRRVIRGPALNRIRNDAADAA